MCNKGPSFAHWLEEVIYVSGVAILHPLLTLSSHGLHSSHHCGGRFKTRLAEIDPRHCAEGDLCPQGSKSWYVSSSFINIVLMVNFLHSDHSLGKLVLRDIIPAVSLVRSCIRLTFSSIFCPEILQLRGVIFSVEAGDIGRSDEFFNAITYKSVFSPTLFENDGYWKYHSAFIKRRCISSWAACFEQINPENPIIPIHVINQAVLTMNSTTMQDSPSISLPPPEDFPSPCSDYEEDMDFNLTDNIRKIQETFVIDTKFDPAKDRNIEVEYNKKDDEQERYKFTKKERAKAKNAETCESLLDLHKKVSDILPLHYSQLFKAFFLH
jgi:hypothetical protein